MQSLIRAASAQLAARIEAATAAYQQIFEEGLRVYEQALAHAQAEYEYQMMKALENGGDYTPTGPTLVEVVTSENVQTTVSERTETTVTELFVEQGRLE